MTRLATGRGNGRGYLENTIAKKTPDSRHSGTAQRNPESRVVKNKIAYSANMPLARLLVPGSAARPRKDDGQGRSGLLFDND
jgi:hypothetical protein